VYTGAKRKVYSCFPARAGSTKEYLFFIILIGLKGYSIITISYRTHMTIYFEHLIRVLGIYD
jgi:hypothetical protein